ncbi:MAG TPA: hypothetical protein VEA37_02350 [Flavobacterium sp.]|nr:hypothetical protein [Flavobacterium sp.]
MKKSLKKALSLLGEDLAEIKSLLKERREPKTATDIEVHFDEVEKLPEQYPIGKWVKEPGIEFGKSLYYIVSIDKDKGINPVNSYGINRNGVWRDIDNRSLELTNWPLATDEEVNTALIAEAERRGFKNGAYVDNSPLGFNFKERLKKGSNIWVSEGYVNIGSDGLAIYKNGKWAEIISEPEIDFSKAGQLVERGGFVAVTSGLHTEKTFTGCLIPAKYKNIDYSQRYFTKEGFILCTEPVTLSNAP